MLFVGNTFERKAQHEVLNGYLCKFKNGRIVRHCVKTDGLKGKLVHVFCYSQINVLHFASLMHVEIIPYLNIYHSSIRWNVIFTDVITMLLPIAH